MARKEILALIAATAALGPARALADGALLRPGFEGAAHLDGDAAIYAAVRLPDVADGFALMDLLGGLFPAALRELTSLRDGLGLYAMGRAEFLDNGIDPEEPALLSWGILDAADWDRVPAEGGKGGKSADLPPIFARHRLVVKTSDAGKFRQYVTSMLSSRDAEVAVVARGKKDPRWPRWYSYVKHLLAPSGPLPDVAQVARFRRGGVVVMRTIGSWAIIDYAEPWKIFGYAYELKRELPALLGRMVAAPRSTFAALLGSGSRRLLGEDASVGVVLRPVPMASLFATPECRLDWAVPGGALLDDATVAIRLHPFEWNMQVAWGLTPVGRARLEGAGTDDGLIDPVPAVAEGVASAGLLLGGLETLRSAPRVGPFTGKLPAILQQMRVCGPLAAAITGVRYWPQLLGLALDAAMPDRASAQLLGSARNLVAVIRNVPDDWQKWQAQMVVLASFPTGIGSELLSMLELQSTGRPERENFGVRSATFYDLAPQFGFSEAGLERIAGSYGLALTPRKTGLGWYYRMRRVPAKRGPRATIGFLHLNVGRLLLGLADTADKATQAAVKLASTQLGRLGGDLRLDDDILRLDLALGK